MSERQSASAQLQNFLVAISACDRCGKTDWGPDDPTVLCADCLKDNGLRALITRVIEQLTHRPAELVCAALRQKARGGFAYDGDPDTAADVVEEELLPRHKWEDPTRDPAATEKSLRQQIPTLRDQLSLYGRHLNVCATRLCANCGHSEWLHDRVEDIDEVTCIYQGSRFVSKPCDCGLTALLAREQET